MQLHVSHKINSELALPINYHHILQSVIYHALSDGNDYTRQVHDYGYENGKRRYKLFQFSLLNGKYRIEQKRIIFSEKVSFEIRSVDGMLIQTLSEYFRQNGIRYGEQHFDEIDIRIEDKSIERSDVIIKMKTPVTVHTTDKLTKKTYFFRPDQERFNELVNDNFKRKYQAYTGIVPADNISFEPVAFREKDKYVTRYKNFYISGWFGVYRLAGERKYLDFLYQTGLGDRNSQGFGMFEIKEGGV